MKESIFSFYVSKSDKEICDMPIKTTVGEYTVHTDSLTPLDVCERGERSLAVFGYAADLLSGKEEKIAEHILSSADSLIGVIDVEYGLGGKYIIFYKDRTGLYIIGDATCSIPVYYTTSEEEPICTSNPMLIVKEKALSPDPTLQKIRSSGKISQAMPFDFTEYKEIKQLIPNHCLSLDAGKAFRFINSKTKQTTLSVCEAREKTKPLIQALTNYYLNKFKVYCPITSGRDSRVVLSFLSMLTDEPTECYTIKHREHTGKEQDLTVPYRLADVENMNYRQIEDIPAPPELISLMNDSLGESGYSARTLNIAHTIKTHFGDGAVINGDIIGQVGKCSLHRDIPTVFATPGYFRCKLHNYSRESKHALKSWLLDIKTANEGVNTFDLFSIENRMGRWAAQENLIYNSISQLYLNIFNSRSIVYIWTAVKRKKRKKSLLHIELIKETSPALLDVPFERDESFLIRLSKSNGLFYYISSYLKFYRERRRFKKEKK